MTFGRNYLLLNGKRPEMPLFPTGQSIIVFDVHKLLVNQKGNYEHGKRNGQDRYVVHAQAREVVSIALRDFRWKALWSTHKEGLDLLSGYPFDEVDYCIAGGMVVNGNLIKDLTILTDDPSLRYVVALEDEDIFFDPLRRVIPVAKRDDLLKKYRDARALVFKRS